MPRQASPVQTLPVHLAESFRVVLGANLGDPLGAFDDLALNDTYQLAAGRPPVSLCLQAGAQGALQVAPGTAVGRPGAALHVDCTLSLMSADGRGIEALVLVETDATGHVAQVYLMPLAPLEARQDLLLVGIDRDSARQRLARMACVSFARGTRITLATGVQCPVEDLQAGDRLLTRDAGVQPVRWVGHWTVRATGAFAPVRLRAGVLNNQGDLVVSPEHRLFIYQRNDSLGAGTAEVLVRAAHLVNGTTVDRLEGGFVDYFQILLEGHHILYAEGIAAEFTLADDRTQAALPPELVVDPQGDAGHGLELRPALLRAPDAAERLRQASRGQG